MFGDRLKVKVKGTTFKNISSRASKQGGGGSRYRGGDGGREGHGERKKKKDARAHFSWRINIASRRFMRGSKPPL
jgi:hypothetical protein